MQELQYTKVLKNDSSFQLVRTNPKLTGNVKISINESGDMYLNAIKANSELSNDDYSKFPIDPARTHPANLFHFFKGGKTPDEIIFDHIRPLKTLRINMIFLIILVEQNILFQISMMKNLVILLQST